MRLRAEVRALKRNNVDRGSMSLVGLNLKILPPSTTAGGHLDALRELHFASFRVLHLDGREGHNLIISFLQRSSCSDVRQSPLHSSNLYIKIVHHGHHAAVIKRCTKNASHLAISESSHAQLSGEHSFVC